MKALIQNNKVVCVSETCIEKCPNFKNCIELMPYDAKTIRQAIDYNILRLRSTMFK